MLRYYYLVVTGGKSAKYLITRAVAIILISGAIAAAFVRVAPGFGIDPRDIDARFSAETLESIRREHESERNPIAYYVEFWRKLVHGDLGHSTVFGEPVGRLVRERAGVTLAFVSNGLLAGWSLALLLGTAAAFNRRVALAPALVVNSALLSVPSAVLATFCVLLQISPALAIAAFILPRAFPYAYEQVYDALSRPNVLLARAGGITEARIVLFHIAPNVAPPLLAFAGVSITAAFGAAIPIEALADVPGLGQMAWRAALGRDVPVLVHVTLFLTTIAVVCNTAADLLMLRFRRVV